MQIETTERPSRIGLFWLLPLLAVTSLLGRTKLLRSADFIDSNLGLLSLQAKRLLGGDLDPFLWNFPQFLAAEAYFISLNFDCFGHGPRTLQLTLLFTTAVTAAAAFVWLHNWISAPRAALLCLPFLICNTWIADGTASHFSACLAVLALAWMGSSHCAANRTTQLSGGTLLTYFAALTGWQALPFLAMNFCFGWAIARGSDFDPTQQKRERSALLNSSAIGIACLVGIIVIRKEIPYFPPQARWAEAFTVFLNKSFYSVLFSWYLAVVLSRSKRDIRPVVHAGAVGVLCSVLLKPLVGDAVLPALLIGASAMATPLFAGTFWKGVLASFLVVTGIYAYGAPLTLALGRTPETSAVDSEEVLLAESLRLRGVRFAVADSAIAYRLAFLFDENPIVAPVTEGLGQRAPYRLALARAPVVAHLFHPIAPREDPNATQAHLLATDSAFQRYEIGQYSVIIRYLKGPALGE